MEFKISYNNKEYTIFHTEFSDALRFYDEIFVSKTYGHASSKHWDVVVDIGANIGLFSLFVAPYAEKVYAVEPLQDNIELLRRMVKKNKFKNIFIEESAISDTTGTKKFHSCEAIGEGFHWGGAAINGWGKYLYDIRSYSLIDFMIKEKIEYIDLLKIDCEGEELQIFDNNFPFDKVGDIVGEIHHGAVNDVKKFLESNGYYVTINNIIFTAIKI